MDGQQPQQMPGASNTNMTPPQPPRRGAGKGLIIGAVVLVVIIIAAVGYIYEAFLAGPTTPPGISNYVPITITNNQSAATMQPFQQEIIVNSSRFSSYEAGNLQNVEFFYGNGTVIPSWLEKGNSGAVNTTYWVKINYIKADSSIRIYMGFASTSTSLFGNGNVGEAPQLSSSYGAYDNGASVFNFYQNFAGSSMPNGWTSTLGFYGGVDDGLNLSSAQFQSGVYYEKGVSPGSVLEAYATPKLGGAMSISVQQSAPRGGNAQGGYIQNGYAGSAGSGWENPQAPAVTAPIWSVSNSTSTVLCNNQYTPQAYSAYVVGLSYSTGNNLTVAMNYHPVCTASTGNLQNENYISLYVYYGADWVVNWFRIRAEPPNGVMPSIAIESVK